MIAVTAGPGLVTSLLVGVQTARTLSYIWKRPLVAVNHIEGHVYANFVGENSKFQIPNSNAKNKADANFVGENSKFQIPNSKVRFPAVVLIVSGGIRSWCL